MFAALLFVFNMLVGYLIGSISSAVIVSRIFNLPDPRVEGSQNPGATNVLRLAGKQYAAIVLIADMLKGFLPVLLAILLKSGPITIGFTCLAAVIGHMYPLFFKFEGGKGVATAMGAFLALYFPLGVIVIATWLLIANFTRYSSAASIISMMLAPIYSIFALGNLDVFLPLMCIAFAILYKHRDNITRLMDGKEPKVNFSYQAKTAQPQNKSNPSLLKVVKSTTKQAPKIKKAATKTTKTTKTSIKTSKKTPTKTPRKTKKSGPQNID